MIFWDNYGFTQPHSGVYTHARRLAEELSKIGVDPTVLVAGSPVAFAKRTLQVPGSARFKLGWSVQAARQAEIDLGDKGGRGIFHGFANINLPIFGIFPKLIPILTVHDLIPVLHWRNSSLPLYAQFQFALPRAVKLAEAIICVSPWTRRTLLERFPQVESKTVVIPNGVDLIEAAPELNIYDEGKPLKVLMVARGERYKRLDLAVDILQRFGAEKMELCVVTDLRGREFLQQVQTQGLSVATDVSAAELQGLYRRCHVYLQTSRFEGFCLPAIEALSQGRPVVYHSGTGFSDFASPELTVGVADEGGEAWVSAVETAASLAKHQDFSQRLQSYLHGLPTWSSSAQELKTLYNKMS